jgi:hypothetical protein
MDQELHDVITQQVPAHKLHAFLVILKRLVREMLILTLPVGLLDFHLAPVQRGGACRLQTPGGRQRSPLGTAPCALAVSASLNACGVEVVTGTPLALGPPTSVVVPP